MVLIHSFTHYSFIYSLVIQECKSVGEGLCLIYLCVLQTYHSTWHVISMQRMFATRITEKLVVPVVFLQTCSADTHGCKWQLRSFSISFCCPNCRSGPHPTHPFVLRQKPVPSALVKALRERGEGRCKLTLLNRKMWVWEAAWEVMDLPLSLHSGNWCHRRNETTEAGIWGHGLLF